MKVVEDCSKGKKSSRFPCQLVHFHFFFLLLVYAALDLTPGDTKALFRRGQAYESCGRTDEAFEDMRKVCELDKTNKGMVPFIFFSFVFRSPCFFLCAFPQSWD